MLVLWLVRAGMEVEVARKRYSVEQIVAKLRESEKLEAQGLSQVGCCGVTVGARRR